MTLNPIGRAQTNNLLVCFPSPLDTLCHYGPDMDAKTGQDNFRQCLWFKPQHAQAHRDLPTGIKALL